MAAAHRFGRGRRQGLDSNIYGEGRGLPGGGQASVLKENGLKSRRSRASTTYAEATAVDRFLS